MATKSKPVDLATLQALGQIARAGRELRIARTDRGLSLRAVGSACGISGSEVSRIERALRPRVSAYDLARLHAAVGLDLSLKSYPGGSPIRDTAHIKLLEAFRAYLHASLAWSTEVPLPLDRDRRAWDAFIRGSDWRYGVEAETSPNDSQALLRRIQLKVRDGHVDGVILVLRATRQTRRFLSEAGPALEAALPVPGRRALARLRAGEPPGGDAMIVLPWRTRPQRGHALPLEQATTPAE